ncbi:MAG: ceramidase domain-containing protein [Methyloceanibacter sp.]|uniref:ceramidase domain-containing protein n=1 Tax=Methyloceanibacter sp. TaxID=1965321 RepID=UPI003EE015F4
MTFGEHVFLYCERGTNEALWAEPINAISNAGFLLAALIFWQLVLWRPREERNADHYLLVALAFLIGFGSLAFHLFADEGTAMADVIPIGLFMLVYLGFALNRFLSVPPGWTVLLVVVFTGLVGAAMQVYCSDGGIGLPGAAPDAKPCLNGSMAYVPALGALIIVGMVAAERHRKAAPYILAAAVVFAVSIILRSVDLALCEQLVIHGRKVGTHFIWHLLNAVVLFLLLRASLETGVKEVTAETEWAPAPVPAPVEAVPAKNELKESPEVASAGEEAVVKAAEPEPQPEPEPEPEAEPEPEPELEDEKLEADDTPELDPEDELEPKAEEEAPAPKKGRGKKKPSSPA